MVTKKITASVFITILLALCGPAQADVYFVHNDHLGTPQTISDKDQQVVWQADYAPFGAAQVTVENLVNNIRFPGQYYDQETGLHYNYYRYYDPQTGRYITSDPIGLNGGLNTYLYANANPIRYFDPNGQSAITWGTFGGAGEGAAAGAGSRGLGLFGLIGVILGGMWPATMGDGTLDNENDDARREECENGVSDWKKGPPINRVLTRFVQF